MKIYVVFGAYGEYSDRENWLVRAYKDKNIAREEVDKLDRQSRAHCNESKEAQKAWAKNVASPYKGAKTTVDDPKFIGCFSCGYITYYYMDEVELLD